MRLTTRLHELRRAQELVAKYAKTGEQWSDELIAERRAEAALALASGLLRPATKTLGLSLGDRVCLALAQDLDCPVLTADRAWESLTLGIKVVVVR